MKLKKILSVDQDLSEEVGADGIRDLADDIYNPKKSFIPQLIDNIQIQKQN